MSIEDPGLLHEGTSCPWCLSSSALYPDLFVDLLDFVIKLFRIGSLVTLGNVIFLITKVIIKIKSFRSEISILLRSCGLWLESCGLTLEMIL